MLKIPQGKIPFLTQVVVYLLASKIAVAAAAPTNQSLSTLAKRIEYSSPATVISEAVTTLSSQISGQIEALPFAVGDQVKKGDQLVRIDCTLLQQQLRQHQAERRALNVQNQFARKQLSRIEAVGQYNSPERKDQYLSNQQVLEAQLEGIEAVIAQSRWQVERCVITSPMDATLLSQPVNIGELAALGTPLLSLLPQKPALLQAEIPPELRESLRQASQLHFVQQQNIYPLRLVSMLPYVDSNTRRQQARLAFTEEAALTGSSGRLVWQGQEFILAAQYLQQHQQQYGIWIEQAGEASFFPLPKAHPGHSFEVPLPADTLLLLNDGAD